MDLLVIDYINDLNIIKYIRIPNYSYIVKESVLGTKQLEILLKKCLSSIHRDNFNDKFTY